MKALSNQFSTTGFSGAVATPTCSSSCCCCCCCVTTAIAGSGIVAQSAYVIARQNKVSKSDARFTTVTAAIAPIAALGLLWIIFLNNPEGMSLQTFVMLGLGILFFTYGLAFRTARSRRPWLVSAYYSLAIFCAVVAEAFIGAGMLLTGLGVVYVILSVIAGVILIWYKAERVKKVNRRP